MRLALLLLAFTLLAANSPAQLIAITFKDPKEANKFKNYLVTFRGQQCIVGEAFHNLKVDIAKHEFSPVRDRLIDIFVADPGDPSKIPYKFDGNEKVVAIKKQVVSVPEPQIADYSFYDESNNLMGLAADYADKKASIEALEKERDAQQRNSPEWMATHRRVVVALEQLRSWLDQSLYPEAATKVAQEVVKQRKLIDAVVAARGIAAKASIKDAPTPEALVKAAQAVSGGADSFKVQESLHGRIVYRNGIADTRVHELLGLVEDAIEGWRVEFIDPYVDAAFSDDIPERMQIEWFFCPDDIGRYERYYTEYYGYNWGEKKAERLQTAGNGVRRGIGPPYLHYWRISDDADLEGIVAHNLGHDLANMHYDKGRDGEAQDWLNEASGYYIAFEWLGRNTVTCKAFAKDAVYAHQVKKEGEKSAQEGLRDWYNALALESGPAIDRLALKTLYEMGDADLAKSWSFFDFVARKCGKPGQQFLRAACNAVRTPPKSAFISNWRAKSQEIFEIQGQDVFAALEKRWKEFAQVGQETGDTRRKR